MISGLLAPIALLSATAGQIPIHQEIDPFLPERFRDAIEQAAVAERDPKRGPNNAMEILNDAKSALAKTQSDQTTFALRVAGVVIRREAMTTGGPAAERFESALSTYSRLDVTEPGLAAWLEDAIKNSQAAEKAFGKTKDRKMLATFLTRGTDLDKKAVEKAFTDAIAATGFKLAIVPAKQAQVVIKLSAEAAKSNDPSRPAVRLVLGIETIQDGKVRFSKSLFRTEAAPTPKIAIDSALIWMAHIGGRDLFFRWLGERAFPTLAIERPGPESGGHDGHQHGPGGPVPPRRP